MNKLSPVPKTFQKSVATPVKVTHHQSKKPDVHATKNQPADKAAAPDNQDQTEQEFSNLVLEQDVKQTQAPTSQALISRLTEQNVKIDAEGEPENDINGEAALIETTILASELANSKLSELNLNQMVNVPTDTSAAVENNLKNTIGSSVENTNQAAQQALADKAPANINQPIADKSQPALVVKKTDNDNVKTASKDNVTAKPALNEQQPLAKTLQNLIERFDNLSTEDLEQIGLTPKQAGKILDHVKNLLGDLNVNDLGAEAEEIIAKLGAMLDKSQNRNFAGVKDILEKIAATLGAKNTPDMAEDANNLPIDSTKSTQQLSKPAQNTAEWSKSVDSAIDQATKTPAERAAVNVADESSETNLSVDKKTHQTNAKPIETAQQDTKPGEAAQQTATNQMSVEANKYANRYSKSQNSENTEPGLNADAGKTASTTHNQLAAAYNNVKSTAETAANKLSNLSALDKINDKSPMDFLNQLQNTAANQQTELNAQDNVVNVKLSMQNGKLTQNLPLNSMAFQMSKQFSKGNSEFQIRLDPAELGRINIKLTLKQGGNVKAHMVTERNDVFELLQRDSRALERALNEAGFDGKNIEVEVSLDQNAQNGGTFAENFFDQPTKSQDDAEQDNKNNNATEEEVIEMVAKHIPLHVTSTGIDRSI